MDTGAFHVGQLGQVLYEVQAQLELTRNALGADRNPEVEAQLKKAEALIAAKAEVLIQAVQGRPRALPVVPGGTMRSLPALDRSGSFASTTGGGRRTPTGSRFQVKRTAGEQMQMMKTAQALANPTSMHAREVLHSRLGVDMPSKRAPDRALGKLPKGRVVHVRPTVGEALPSLNRHDPSAPLPPPSQDERNKGVYNMLNRGVLSSTIDLTSELIGSTASVTAGPAHLHDFQDQHIRAEAFTEPFSYNPTNIKLDPRPSMKQLQVRRSTPTPNSKAANAPPPTVEIRLPSRHGAGLAPRSILKSGVSSAEPGDQTSMQPQRLIGSGVLFTGAPGALSNAASQRVAAAMSEMHAQQEDARGFDELMDSHSLHHFMIRNGKTYNATPEFRSFKRKFAGNWARIQLVIASLEQLFQKYAGMLLLLLL
eukprot:TRINITY_DN1154_c0_g1_i2.p1 TRINITY_DN1154_c0_g1~~TRINITY_DN1154_c0_g1_i2.p1  ORF type:complete len:424 (-),score=95.89 TRINITY_DN1154_c0_g1_i2:15-1286(-)